MRSSQTQYKIETLLLSSTFPAAAPTLPALCLFHTPLLILLLNFSFIHFWYISDLESPPPKDPCAECLVPRVILLKDYRTFIGWGVEERLAIGACLLLKGMREPQLLLPSLIPNCSEVSGLPLSHNPIMKHGGSTGPKQQGKVIIGWKLCDSELR